MEELKEKKIDGFVDNSEELEETPLEPFKNIRETVVAMNDRAYLNPLTLSDLYHKLQCDYSYEKFNIQKLVQEVANIEAETDANLNGYEDRKKMARLDYKRSLLCLSREKMFIILKLAKNYGFVLDRE